MYDREGPLVAPWGISNSLKGDKYSYMSHSLNSLKGVV